MLLRETNTGCFTCGAQIPNEVRHQTDGPYEWFECPNCLSLIASGIVQRNGRVRSAPVRVPREIPVSAQEVEASGWTTAELWWTNSGEYVTRLNGRRIKGDAKVGEFIDKLFSLL